MNLKDSLKKIEKLTNLMSPSGWDRAYSHERLHYNEMTFIPHFKYSKANRILENVPTLEDTVNKLSNFVDTIKSTDIDTLTSTPAIDLYASKVYPNEMEKNSITVMTNLQIEVNSAWYEFYTSEMVNAHIFDEDVHDSLVQKTQHIEALCKQLEEQRVEINRFLMFNYTLTNQLGISLPHEDDRSYVAKSMKDYIEKNTPDMVSFNNIYTDYVTANTAYFNEIKVEISKVNPSVFVTNADLFINTLQKTSSANAVESFLVEKMLTDDAVITSFDFTASQKINKVVLFDDSSIAYKKDGEYHTFKDTATLKSFVKDVHNDALSYLLRKKPATINFFKDKLREDGNYNNAINAATSFLDNYVILKQYGFDLNAFNDKDFEAMDDNINHIVNKNKIKQFAFSILSSKYKHLFNETTEPYFKELHDNDLTTGQLQTFVGKKLAALKSNDDVITMLHGVLNHFDGFTQEALTDKLSARGIAKIHDQDNVVTFEVTQYDHCKSLGSTSWCIVREQSYYDQYVTETGNKQYIMYDFNKPSTDINSMIGFTVDSAGSVYAEHAKNDDAISKYNKDEQLLKIQTNTIYKNKDRHSLTEATVADMKDILGIKEDRKITKHLKARAL